MALLIFEYDLEGRPRAKITFSLGEIKFDTLAIIDSGADSTTLPKEVGEYLKLEKPNDSEKNTCITLSCADGNKTKYVIRKVKTKIGKEEFNLQICWMYESEGHILLGRDIFDKFDILFKQNPHRKVIFDSTKKVFNVA